MAGQHKQRRLSRRTVQRQKERFLKAYARLGNATAAAEETGVERYRHRYWLQTSSSYKEAFAAADDEATEVLEREARRRALEGREEPVWYNGQQIGTTRKFSDVLLIFLLKAKRPDVYRDAWQTKINNNLNVASAVKVVHEYHAGEPAQAVQDQLQEPNRNLLGPIEATAVQPDSDDPPAE